MLVRVSIGDMSRVEGTQLIGNNVLLLAHQAIRYSPSLADSNCGVIGVIPGLRAHMLCTPNLNKDSDTQ